MGPSMPFCLRPGHAIIFDKPSLSTCQGSAGLGLGHGWHAWSHGMAMQWPQEVLQVCAVLFAGSETLLH